ncbi:MAG: hypothetical protein AAF633_19315 [Chloroflexota bacterium]
MYEVFARVSEPALHHIGSVVAANEELAKMYAAKLYDEWGWREMMIIRRSDISVLIEPI